MNTAVVGKNLAVAEDLWQCKKVGLVGFSVKNGHVTVVLEDYIRQYT